MSFLTAGWRKLILANYEIDPELLMPYLPDKTELDTWNGVHYVSLVGFMFVDVKVLGVPVPFYVNFEEVNLRFYVKHKSAGEWKRGVVFIKEIVPKAAVTFIANTLYNEHYETRSMRHHWVTEGEQQRIAYSWDHGGQIQSMEVLADSALAPILPGSEEEFITEHYWGYTRVQDGKTFQYEVRHPRWEHYPIIKHKLAVDFSLVYGEAFQHLNDIAPRSVMLAEGSAITVEGKRRL